MDWISLYLQEDFGDDGDITSESIFQEENGAATLVARESCFVTGANHAADVFAKTGAHATVHADDAWVEKGTAILTVSGPTTSILKGERVALNLISRMSGIATQTRTMVETMAKQCGSCRIAGTRKTTPGFRFFEKEAIKRAGGDPHRFGLFDEGMIKDNHREAAGLLEAIKRFRAAWPQKTLTVEVETLEDGLLAAANGANWIMIDNQTPETGKAWAKALWNAHPGIKVEASGGIHPENMMEYAWADRISFGALTHQAQSKDFGLDWSTP